MLAQAPGTDVATERDQLFMRFATGVADKRVITRGWSDPEAWGVWSVGPQAELSLWIGTRIKNDVDLEITAKAVVAQEIRVEANGEEVAKWQLDTQNRAQRVTIPKAYAAKASPMKIVFNISKPTSPQDLGTGTDGRKLGIGVIGASVRY